MALAKVTVTATVLLPDDQTPCTGEIVFTPGTGLLVDPIGKHTLCGDVTGTLEAGVATVELPPTDAEGTQPEPNTWNWTARFKLNEAAVPPFSFALPYTTDTVDITEVIRVAPAPGTYLVVPGPEGPQGPAGPKGDPGESAAGALIATSNLADIPDKATARGNLGLGTAATANTTAFDASGAAATAQTNAETAAAADATNKVTAHTQAADPHGDRQWAVGQFDPAGAAAAAQAAAEGYADNGDTATLTAAQQYTDTHTGSGGGTSIRTASVKVTDDDLSGLPAAASWTVAATSAGTRLQASIPAAAGDRIRIHGNFMRTGSHFLDWAVTDGADTILTFVTSSSSTPPAEGNPVLYPSLSFSYATSSDMVTAASGHLTAGTITIALVHQGSAAATVYAHPTYPWKLRLENIGPEPV